MYALYKYIMHYIRADQYSLLESTFTKISCNEAYRRTTRNYCPNISLPEVVQGERLQREREGRSPVSQPGGGAASRSGLGPLTTVIDGPLIPSRSALEFGSSTLNGVIGSVNLAVMSNI